MKATETPFTVGTLADIGGSGFMVQTTVRIARAVAAQPAKRCSICGRKQVVVLSTDEQLHRRAAAPHERATARWDVCDRCLALALVRQRTKPDGADADFNARVPLWAQALVLRDRDARVQFDAALGRALPEATIFVVDETLALRPFVDEFLAMTPETSALLNANRPVRPLAERFCDWLAGPDTGFSSRALAFRLMDAPFPKVDAWAFGSATRHPLDPDDLGRCLRMLDRLPELRSRLATAADLSPEWRSLISAWAEIEALYRDESRSRDATRCYARMQELLRDSEPDQRSQA